MSLLLTHMHALQNTEAKAEEINGERANTTMYDIDLINYLLQTRGYRFHCTFTIIDLLFISNSMPIPLLFEPVQTSIHNRCSANGRRDPLYMYT